MTRGRRAAPLGLTVMSGAIVTAALFPDLGGGVNVGGVARFVCVVPDKRAERALIRDPKPQGGVW